MEYLGIKTVIIVVGVLSTALAWINYNKYKAQKTLYAFCEIRRRLVDLLHRGEVEMESSTFLFHYQMLNHIIHYSQDFRFNNKDIIEILNQDEIELERTAFIQELTAEIEHLEGEPKEVIHSFYTEVVKAFWRHSILVRVLLFGWIAVALSQAASGGYRFYTNAKDLRAAAA